MRNVDPNRSTLALSASRAEQSRLVYLTVSGLNAATAGYCTKCISMAHTKWKAWGSWRSRRLVNGRLFAALDGRSPVTKTAARFAMLLFIFAAVYTLLSPPMSEITFQPEEVAFNDSVAYPANSRHQHVILMWTKFYGDDFVPSLRLHQEAESGIRQCPHSNCLLSNDRRRYRDSAALVFHMRDFSWDDVPLQRRPEQYYVFYSLESPVHTFGNLDRQRGFFNLTFTYRLDSDVVTDSYFQHFHPSLINEQQLDELLTKKAGFAVTFVSNCHWIPSRRDVYVKLLANYVHVDIYGKCGSKQCSTDTPEICDQLVADYKFYLAFENSVCKDYVTEKIHRAFNYGAVPVVYGGANYSAIFPSGSFINVLDFSGPKALAQYLLFLDKNPSEYRRYFQWRMHPTASRLAGGLTADNWSWCRICRILNTRLPRRKVMVDMGQWWRDRGWCRTPQTEAEQWMKNPEIPLL
ncbi:alpha-(1,3)-fucosyltransferase C-like [Paramacrobiotus metropolitanus]|uniref:alpha-(1,3)-fucosyltransferase C-like n=1 Tax=Paramacrobiotus metropolitanus TaxID=2943436 RepID=UPI0024464DC3|nr:alpha-(1,3)-fucosyltransferase C-like [Paramacrobiotus metropolitanus]